MAGSINFDRTDRLRRTSNSDVAAGNIEHLGVAKSLVHSKNEFAARHVGAARVVVCVIKRDRAAGKLNAAFTRDVRADGPGLSGFGRCVDPEAFFIARQQIDLREIPGSADAALIPDQVPARVRELGRCRAVRIAPGLLNLLNLIDGIAEIEAVHRPPGHIDTSDEQQRKLGITVKDTGTRNITSNVAKSNTDGGGPGVPEYSQVARMNLPFGRSFGRHRVAFHCALFGRYDTDAEGFGRKNDCRLLPQELYGLSGRIERSLSARRRH